MIKEEKRYIVSIGKYKSEKQALERKAQASTAGLYGEIIDLDSKELPDLYAAVLLVAEQVKALTDGLTKMVESNTELLKALREKSPESVNTEKPKAKKFVENGNMEMAHTLMMARKRKGYLQTELGAIVGVSGKCISNYETGKNIPKDVLKKLKLVLQISEE